jgi:hypothetical protein
MQNYAAKIEWLAVKEEAIKMLTLGYSYTGPRQRFVRCTILAG